MPGPPAKRNAERRRRNKESQNEVVKTTGRVPVPVLPKTAHAIARRWYLSLKTSAQSQFFEPSDWSAALIVVEQITRLMADSNLSLLAKDYGNIGIRAGQFASLWAAMNDLLSTEGSRRRVRLEIERGSPEPEVVPPGVSDLMAFRKANQA